jgi:hypothetical protein
MHGPPTLIEDGDGATRRLLQLEGGVNVAAHGPLVKGVVVELEGARNHVARSA